MVQVVAADLERRKEEMGVSKVVQMQVGGEEGKGPGHIPIRHTAPTHHMHHAPTERTARRIRF